MKDSQLPGSQSPYQTPQSATGQLNSNNAEYAEFKLFSMGRVGRIRGLLYTWLPIGIMGIIAKMVVLGGSGKHMGIANVVLALFILVFIFNFTLMVRRLHDFNISGLFILFALVPLLNVILIIALLFVSGTDGPNRFGPPIQPNKPIEIWLVIGGLLVLFLPGIIKQYFQTVW